MKRYRSLTVLLCLALSLTACVQTDADLAQDFLNDWMKAKKILVYDEDKKEWVYNKKLMAGVMVGWDSTGDPLVDSIIQSLGLTAESIKNAEKQKKDADAALVKKPPDLKGARGHLDAAVNMRPHDWHYRNKRAEVYLLMGNDKSAANDMKVAVEKCDDNERCEDAALRDQESILRGLVQKEQKSGQSASCATHRQLAETYRQLAQVRYWERENYEYLQYQNEDLANSGNCR